MLRLSLCLAATVGALVLAPAALAAGGPLYVTQGGAGVASYDGAFHYVTVSYGTRGTLVERIDARGEVLSWVRVDGSWGIPTVGSGSPTGQGLSRDGHTLVLGSTGGPYVSPSRFLILDTRRMRVLRTIALGGSFTFDALSSDASRLYLIEYIHERSGDVSDYIVRGYDLRTDRLLPGRIADRAEKDTTMAGYALNRTTSADGRWVYTLYETPAGTPFVHALDTVGATAHCIVLPWSSSDPGALQNVGLSLRHGDRTLAVLWRSGRPWLNVTVGTWRISYPRAGFPWAWVAAGIGGGLALLAAAALFLRRRRGEELQEHAGKELGLA